jgi:hypothetical protein
MFLLWLLLAFVLVMGIAMALTLRVALNWSKELLELQRHGAETTGRVLEKRESRRRGATSRWIRYEYVDPLGRTHRSRRNLVTPDAWDAHTEGGPINVVYSQRRPKVSSPKYLFRLDPKREGESATR